MVRGKRARAALKRLGRVDPSTARLARAPLVDTVVERATARAISPASDVLSVTDTEAERVAPTSKRARLARKIGAAAPAGEVVVAGQEFLSPEQTTDGGLGHRAPGFTTLGNLTPTAGNRPMGLASRGRLANPISEDQWRAGGFRNARASI